MRSWLGKAEQARELASQASKQALPPFVVLHSAPYQTLLWRRSTSCCAMSLAVSGRSILPFSALETMQCPWRFLVRVSYQLLLWRLGYDQLYVEQCPLQVLVGASYQSLPWRRCIVHGGFWLEHLTNFRFGDVLISQAGSPAGA